MALTVELEVEIDDDLVATAREYSGIDDLDALIDKALRELVERERAGRQL